MCPACITTVALMVAGATSTGGLTMLAVKKLCAKGSTKNINPTTPNKGGPNGSSKSRITN